MFRHPTRCGAATSPTSGSRGNGITWRSCWIFARAGWWAGCCRKSRTPIWLSRRWIWLTSNEEDPRACCFTRIKGRPVCESFISPAAVALSHAPEHESPGELLGQRANGARVPQLENGVDTDHGLQNGSRSPARYQPLLDASVQLGSTPSIQRWAGARSGRRKLNVVSGIS